jgi:hypothetical protein
MCSLLSVDPRNSTGAVTDILTHWKVWQRETKTHGEVIWSKETRMANSYGIENEASMKMEKTQEGEEE